MVAQTCNPSYLGAETGGRKFKASLGYSLSNLARRGIKIRIRKRARDIVHWQKICLAYIRL